MAAPPHHKVWAGHIMGRDGGGERRPTTGVSTSRRAIIPRLLGPMDKTSAERARHTTFHAPSTTSPSNSDARKAFRASNWAPKSGLSRRSTPRVSTIGRRLAAPKGASSLQSQQTRASRAPTLTVPPSAARLGAGIPVAAGERQLPRSRAAVSDVAPGPRGAPPLV